MKHLMHGATIAAALAIATPVWAQTGAPMTPASPGAPSVSMAPDTTAAAPRHRARHHRPVRHSARSGRGGNASADNVASQLNQQELSRLQTGGGAAAPMAPAPMDMPAEGPRPSGGTGRGR
jgi:hypothetical protein